MSQGREGQVDEGDRDKEGDEPDNMNDIESPLPKQIHSSPR
jgi:hypothetical protein